ncbi:MAG: amino acid ABC transporter permease [Coriobacteriales bacterium]|jgi:polar amino acid transport system substrate-binding protein|nr:amino acid ABC transporter permease [Coriobacteriales bacterium]
MLRNTATRALRNACVFVAVLCLVLGSMLVVPPQSAFALSTDRTTAQSNEDGGKDIIGGEPTRLSWEGTVGSDETVTQIVLNFPEGCDLATDAYVKVQEILMDDPAHPLHDSSIIYTENLTVQTLTLDFSPGLRPNNKVIIQVYGFILPPVSGDYVLTGTYNDGSGATSELADSPAITAIGITGTQQFINWLAGQDWVKAWNSVKILNIFLNPLWLVASVPSLFLGWIRSLGLVLIGFPLAIPIGLGISFLRMSNVRILRFLSSIYVNVIRGTPLFLQIYIAVFGLPHLGVKLDLYLLGALVLALNSSAYLAEIFRAGIQSIQKGQFEAASSLGMNAVQSMFFVIIPQTVRRVIPTMTSEFILLYKDTSLLAAVGVMEQMMFAKTLVNTTGNMTPYVVSACYYLIVTLPLTRIISVFERKLAASDGREAPPEGKKKGSGDTGLSSKRVGLFKTIAPLSAVDAKPDKGITPEQHDSQ